MNSPSVKKTFNSTEDARSQDADCPSTLPFGHDLKAERPRAARRGLLKELLRAGEARLKAAGADAPGLCCEMLLAHALGCDRAALFRRPEEAVSDEEAVRFERLLSRRAAREPVQQIVGCTEFWSLRILCDSRALIPRPETELLVEAALGLLKGAPLPFIADIGTGTGCIAIALATELRGARICASDLSRDALALAAQNLAEHGLARRVRLFEGDLARPFLEQGLEARFDAVVCNPPYIAEREIAFLQPEVRDHDPRLALDGGPDGLRFIRRLLAEAPALLKPEGHLILEAAEGQAGRIRALAADSGGAAPFGRLRAEQAAGAWSDRPRIRLE